MDWTQICAEYNKDNLDTHNVFFAANLSYALVHKNHPVIALLRVNQHQMNMTLEEAALTHEWYRIGKSTLHCCCDFIRRNHFAVDYSNDKGLYFMVPQHNEIQQE